MRGVRLSGLPRQRVGVESVVLFGPTFGSEVPPVSGGHPLRGSLLLGRLAQPSDEVGGSPGRFGGEEVGVFVSQDLSEHWDVRRSHGGARIDRLDDGKAEALVGRGKQEHIGRVVVVRKLALGHGL